MNGSAIDRFIECADVARSVLANSSLGRRWVEKSPLSRMTLGEVAAHTARAVHTVAIYLDAEQPPPGSSMVDPAEYFRRNDVRAPDLDDEVATAVRARASEGADRGQAAVVAAYDESMALLTARLPDELGRAVAVRNAVMAIEDYLLTRVVELVIHTDDLATGLGIDTPSFSPEALEIVVDTLLAIVRDTHDPLTIVRSMTRVERAIPEVFRVL